MKDKHGALDWALTYLRAIVGREIEENEEFKQACKILEEDIKNG